MDLKNLVLKLYFLLFASSYVYALDGVQVTLPRTEDIIKADDNGRKVSRYREFKKYFGELIDRSIETRESHSRMLPERTEKLHQ